jgi:hypothetical protein
MLYIQQNRVEMLARKLITYHDLRLSLCIHMGLPSVARLQREEVSRAKKEARGTGKISTGFYEALHPLLNFANVFDHADHTAKAHKSTGSTASFEIHGKYNTNLIDFIDNGAPFDTSGAHIPHSNGTCIRSSSQWQWHFRSSCQSCFRCVFAIKFYLEIPNPIHRQWRPFHITHSQR